MEASNTDDGRSPSGEPATCLQRGDNTPSIETGILYPFYGPWLTIAGTEQDQEKISSEPQARGCLGDTKDKAVIHEAICGQQYEYGDYHGSRFRRLASKSIISFGPNDPENPLNWSKKKKFYIVVTGIIQVMNSTFGSSICSNAMDPISKEFNITNSLALVLPISVFLIGYVCGPLLWGPISEAYGRKRPLLIAFTLFTIFMMACALAPSYSALLIFRFFNGAAASAPIAMVGGMYADINNDPTVRGRTMAYFMACTTFGPYFGPPVSGFVSVKSWRWCFWIGLICAAVSYPLVLFMPETYGPVILQKRARKLRKEAGNENIIAQLDIENRDLARTLRVTLSRPFRMIIQESIVSLTSLYCALAYAIYYLYFEAYPIIFEGIYGMSSGVAGLCFLPLGLGAIISCFIFIWYDGFLARAKSRGAIWAQSEEFRRLPLACVGGPLWVVSIFWIAWSASPTVPWAAPMLSGIPFGIGYMLIFMAMLNYLTDAYETLSASAQSAASCTRSTFGAVLPLASKPMFDRLGIHWAGTLIAFVGLGVSVIPFAFIRYGDRIRANSRFCQELQRMKEAEKRELEEGVMHGESSR